MVTSGRFLAGVWTKKTDTGMNVFVLFHQLDPDIVPFLTTFPVIATISVTVTVTIN